MVRNQFVWEIFFKTPAKIGQIPNLMINIKIKYMLQGAGKLRGDGKLKYGGNLTLQYPNSLPLSALIYRLA